MLKAEHLLAFCKAAQQGSISAAAETLGLTQPAVSNQLIALQKHTGQTLYRRMPHGIELTPAGDNLLPYACAVAETLTQTQLYLNGEIKTGTVTLRIGLSHHLVPSFTGLLLKAAKLFSLENNSLQVHLVEGYSQSLMEEVLQRRLDAALIITAPEEIESSLVSQSYKREKICLLVKPDDPISEQITASLDIIKGETLILSSSRSQVYKRVQDSLFEAQVMPGRILEVSGPGAVKSAVMDGLGIGVTLPSFVKIEVDANWFQLVELEGNNLAVDVSSISHNPATLEPVKRKVLKSLLNQP